MAESNDVCIGKLPLSQASLDAIAPIQLQTPGTGDVCLEVWVAATRDAPFMQFFGACRIDPAAWARDEPHERWYGLDLPASKRKSAWGEDQQSTSAYRDAAPENERAGAFVKVVAVFTHRNKMPPTPSIYPLMETDGQQGFQFIMPHKTIRRRALLRRLSVHEVKHQVNGLDIDFFPTIAVICRRTDCSYAVYQYQIGVLEELLSTTLYGAFGDRGEAVSRNRGLDKALALLQLSCQYALHTTTELQKCSRYDTMLTSIVLLLSATHTPFMIIK
jgi:hypothetical protein